MKICRLNTRRGLTLVELTVSVGLTIIIFGTLAFLLFFAARNSYIVRDQSLSQSQAAAAAERVSNILRNSRVINPIGSDDMSTTLSRLAYEIPDYNSDGSAQKGVIAFVPATNANSSDGMIKIFEKSSDYKPSTVATDKASYTYRYIQNFNVKFRSNSWVTVGVSYSYRGFSLPFSDMSKDDRDGDGIIDNRLVGEFLTDAIAKNHHPGESAHYAQTTTTLFQL